MNGLPDLGSGPLDIVVRTAIIYVFVVLGLRLAGKGEVGQLSIVDLVALLLLANAVQNAMVGQDSSIIGGVLAAVTILVLARILKELVQRYRPVERAILGEPRLLVRDGVVLTTALKQEEISLDELRAGLREHGLEQPDQVALAVSRSTARSA